MISLLGAIKKNNPKKEEKREERVVVIGNTCVPRASKSRVLGSHQRPAVSRPDTHRGLDETHQRPSVCTTGRLAPPSETDPQLENHFVPGPHSIGTEANAGPTTAEPFSTD